MRCQISFHSEIGSVGQILTSDLNVDLYRGLGIVDAFVGVVSSLGSS